MILFTMMRETRRVTISQTGYEKRKKNDNEEKKNKNIQKATQSQKENLNLKLLTQYRDK